MSRNEAQTRYELIDPALRLRGWNETNIKVEATSGGIIVIDECHRSAWGKWSQALTRNGSAVQIGLTATPRGLIIEGSFKEAEADREITADNLRYFGEPVYEYTMPQAVEDGYLAACEIRHGRVNLDDTGITLEELLRHNPLNYITGERIAEDDLENLYKETDYESRLLLPDRISAMCADLFNCLLQTGTPEQKTIIFCVRDIHAEIVAAEMNNLCYKQRSWLDNMPDQTKAVIHAIAAQFGREGTEVFENPQLFNVASVRTAGGLNALGWNGGPAELIAETKMRLFAA